MEECDFWMGREEDCCYAGLCNSQNCKWALRAQITQLKDEIYDLKSEISNYKGED